MTLLTTPPGFDRRRLLLKSAIEVANMLEQGWWRIELVEKIVGVAHLLARPFETIWHDMLQLVLNVARNPHVPGYGLLARQLAAMPEPEQPLSQSFLNLSIQWDPASSSEPPAEFRPGIELGGQLPGQDMAQERVIFFRHNSPHWQLSATQYVGLNDDDTLIAARCRWPSIRSLPAWGKGANLPLPARPVGPPACHLCR